MTGAELFRQIDDAGLNVRAAGDCVAASPAALLTPDMRALLIERKPELLAFLREAERAAAEVVDAAKRRGASMGVGK
ncbi:MAG: hypothetical protein J7605_14400 [Variovorax sp.]|nr:hypothetical protein [Variovorax sp.]